MVDDDITDIRNYYEANPEQEADRIIRHPIEFEITMRYFKQHFPKNGVILDVGCGSGTYSIPLAKAGYEITAVDLSPALIHMCNTYAEKEGISDRVRTHVADARDLSFVPDAAFDAGMVMGPLYHLIYRDDRQSVIRQVISKLKSGAPFFSAHISRIGMLPHIALRVPEWIENQESVRSTLTRGHFCPTHPRDGRFRGYFTTIDELKPLHEELGIETIAIAASDPASIAIDRTFRTLPKNQQMLWLDVLFECSAEPSFRGAWPHLLYIGRKRE